MFQNNSAPKVIDDQELPRKLQEIAKLREETKRNAKKKPPKKPKRSDGLLDSSKHMGSEMRLPGMKKNLKPIPVFKQNPGEKERQFFRRVNNTVNQFLKQKEYEAKYDVDLVQDPSSGKTSFIQREKDELEEHVDKLKSNQLLKKGIVRKTKEEKRKEKRLKEKKRRLKKRGKKTSGTNHRDKSVHKDSIQNDFANLTDSVKFNEIVHAPPRLQGVKINEARKPGGNKDLLLLQSSKGKHKKNSEVTMKKQKVRMSLAKKQRLESERKSVIQQYRALKQRQ